MARHIRGLTIDRLQAGQRRGLRVRTFSIKIFLFAMNTPLSEQQIDVLARRRAGAKLGWFTHALVYLVVNVGLFLLASGGSGGRPWSIYPALGWGLGLLLHGVAVFVLGTGSGLYERMSERERKRLRRSG